LAGAPVGQQRDEGARLPPTSTETRQQLPPDGMESVIFYFYKLRLTYLFYSKNYINNKINIL
jgi:hypothetical protein